MATTIVIDRSITSATKLSEEMPNTCISTDTRLQNATLGTHEKRDY
jgi:hypothetical protein